MWFKLLDENVELVYNKRNRKYNTDFMTSQEHRLDFPAKTASAERLHQEGSLVPLQRTRVQQAVESTS